MEAPSWWVSSARVVDFYRNVLTPRDICLSELFFTPNIRHFGEPTGRRILLFSREVPYGFHLQ